MQPLKSTSDIEIKNDWTENKKYLNSEDDHANEEGLMPRGGWAGQLSLHSLASWEDREMH